MNRTIQIAFGLLAVGGAAALSRREPSGSLGAVPRRRKSCGFFNRGEKDTRYSDIKFPSVVYGTVASERAAFALENLAYRKYHRCRGKCYETWNAVMSARIGRSRRSKHFWNAVTRLKDEHPDTYSDFESELKTCEAECSSHRSLDTLFYRKRALKFDTPDLIAVYDRLTPTLYKWRGLIEDSFRFVFDRDISASLINTLHDEGYNPADPKIRDLTAPSRGYYFSNFEKLLSIPENERVYEDLTAKWLTINNVLDDLREIRDWNGGWEEKAELLTEIGDYLCANERRFEAIKKSCEDGSRCMTPIDWKNTPLLDDA